MSILDRLFKKKGETKKETIEVVKPTNKYYVGDNYFEYTMSDNFGLTCLKIISEVDKEKYPNLYLCKFEYSHKGPKLMYDDADNDLKGFENIYIGFDKDNMINNETYCEYVFKSLLNPEHVRDLYENEFEKIGIKKLGNYVGSVEYKDNQVFPAMHYDIGGYIESLPKTKELHEKYDTGAARRLLEEQKQGEIEKQKLVESYMNTTGTAQEITEEEVGPKTR